MVLVTTFRLVAASGSDSEGLRPLRPLRLVFQVSRKTAEDAEDAEDEEGILSGSRRGHGEIDQQRLVITSRWARSVGFRL